MYRPSRVRLRPTIDSDMFQSEFTIGGPKGTPDLPGRPVQIQSPRPNSEFVVIRHCHARKCPGLAERRGSVAWEVSPVGPHDIQQRIQVQIITLAAAPGRVRSLLATANIPGRAVLRHIQLNNLQSGSSTEGLYSSPEQALLARGRRPPPWVRDCFKFNGAAHRVLCHRPACLLPPRRGPAAIIVWCKVDHADRDLAHPQVAPVNNR